MFTDRIDAATQLAEHVRQRVQDDEVVVLGLPRGGVPVAAEVAEVIGAPLDVIVVRKLGVPQQPEIAMGAIGEDGARFADEEIVARVGVSSGQFARVEQTEREILTRRLALLRRGRSPTSIAGRTVLIVDDGIATGATARVACRVARERGATWVIVAVPVAPVDAARRMPEADEVVAVLHPDDVRAVGQFYREFPQTGDDEVILLLEAGDRRRQGAHTISRARIRESEVRVPGEVAIRARDWLLTHLAPGLVSIGGSSR